MDGGKCVEQTVIGEESRSIVNPRISAQSASRSRKRLYLSRRRLSCRYKNRQKRKLQREKAISIAAEEKSQQLFDEISEPQAESYRQYDCANPQPLTSTGPGESTCPPPEVSSSDDEVKSGYGCTVFSYQRLEEKEEGGERGAQEEREEEKGDREEERREDEVEEREEGSEKEYELTTDSCLDAKRLPAHRIEGRRIVDLQHVFEEFHRKFDEHSRGIECRFADLVIVGSQRHGLKTTIEIQCQMCLYKDKIWSEPKDNGIMDINHGAVAGTITTGGGRAQIEEFLAAVDVPCMSEKTYRHCHDNVVMKLVEASQDEMAIAAEEEKQLAIARGDILPDWNIPYIPVVADGSWMKRSYKSGRYDSLSGVGVIVGFHTKKVLFIGVRNKYCSVCEAATRRGEDSTEHVCYKNWGRHQTSTSMESDAIVEGFVKSITMYGLVYNTLIGDGDSSVYKRILDANPYNGIVAVKKIECSNHLLRNFCNKARDAAKAGRLGRWRAVIDGQILRMRGAIAKAAAYRNEEEVPTAEKIQNLRRDLANVPSHVFGEHRDCARLGYFCDGSRKGNEENVVPQLTALGIYGKIQDAIVPLNHNAESLLYNTTNNTVETYNSFVCKFIGGKRINFCRRGSYTGRCAAAVLQHNTGEVLGTLSTKMHKQTPNSVKIMDERRKRMSERKAKAMRAARRLFTSTARDRHSTSTVDKDYGPNAEKPDMDEEAYYHPL